MKSLVQNRIPLQSIPLRQKNLHIESEARFLPRIKQAQLMYWKTVRTGVRITAIQQVESGIIHLQPGSMADGRPGAAQ